MRNPTYVVMFITMAFLLIITFILVLSKVGTVTLVASPSVDGDSTTVNSPSGLEFIDYKLTLIRGCTENQILKWNESTDLWECTGRNHEYYFHNAGDVWIPNDELASFTLNTPVTYTDLVCNTYVAPTGSAITVNLQENGSDIFSDANRVSIAAGTKTDRSGVPTDTTGALNDVITLIIDEVDSGNTGSTLTCQLSVVLN